MTMKLNRLALAALLAGAGTAPAWGQMAMDMSTPMRQEAAPSAGPQKGPMPSGATNAPMGDMSGSRMNGKQAAMAPSAGQSGQMPSGGMNGSTAAARPGAMQPAGMTMASTPASPAPAADGAMATMDDSAAMAGMDGAGAQGGTAPADARDPNAYSDGYTLDRGAYALPGTRQLRLGDEDHFGSLLLNRLERAYAKDANSTAYDAQAWFGRDYDKLVVKAEGEVAQGKLQDARTEALWGHAIGPFWDTQLGVRYDSGDGLPGRKWLALGVQGLAPYWFEVDAAAYLGEGGRTALRLGAEYEILLTQQWILQPSAELNVYGQDDTERGIGSGLSSGTAGLRLRYEINRQLAPYVGVERNETFGATADLARTAGRATGETRWVAGLRLWF